MASSTTPIISYIGTPGYFFNLLNTSGSTGKCLFYDSNSEINPEVSLIINETGDVEVYIRTDDIMLENLTKSYDINI